ncbi:hypothetical protein BKG78_23280 [Mycobacteroides chelonae]|nr:hypothetical protein BKG78_23280 [Mycobacteroides chelonae]
MQGEYLSQYADSDPAHRHDPGIEAFKDAGQFRDMVSTFDQGQYAGEIINEQAQAQHQQLLNDAARTGSDLDLNAAGRLSQGMLDGALDSIGEKPTNENFEDIKKLVGKVPFAGDAMDVLDSAQRHMDGGTKLPDGFAQNLAQSGSFGNITSYQTSVLDALAQAHPGISDDPIVGKYINNGHFDPSTIPNGGELKAQHDLSRWFNEVAPRAYNVDLDHWLQQEDWGRRTPNWTPQFGPQR